MRGIRTLRHRRTRRKPGLLRRHGQRQGCHPDRMRRHGRHERRTDGIAHSGHGDSADPGRSAGREDWARGRKQRRCQRQRSHLQARAQRPAAARHGHHDYGCGHNARGGISDTHRRQPHLPAERRKKIFRTFDHSKVFEMVAKI